MAAAGGVYEPLPPPCALSPGSRDLLALSGADGRIQVWDTRGPGLRREYVPSAHLSATCTCLAWAPARGFQVSIEDRLGAMDIDLPKVPVKSGLPQMDNFSVLLVQGLESSDINILNKVLLTKNEPLIKKTVARIPVYAVLPLVHELTKRLQRHPSR
ncbi:hypothetical protein GDO81_022650 [Engystomops pustulosus]|uniref:Uncharacterized protein n=1 Tax=Engystomops pustulosus TaxID=76066 RepID=A0AAV6ZDL7_ENGPU|nr:hypothetical protein GDO81_022650 [Engystomops pustulosus]